ncbi:MAG: ATP-dependent helicase [bacterium]
MSTSILKKLTDEQRKIVAKSDGYSLVIASAGTGKTTTIVGRIAHLIEVKKVDPKNILLLTFTNKAAEEMIGRLKKQYKNSEYDVSTIWSGTFHSVANKLLRMMPKEALLPYGNNFTIKTATSIRNTFRMLFNEAGLPKEPTASELLDLYWYAINTGAKKEAFVETLKGNRAIPKALRSDVQNLMDAYESTKADFNAMDFNDLLYVLSDKLLKNPELMQQVAGQFHYVLVDEYQDTNQLQERMVESLGSVHKNIFAVGDYDQTIFSFQGSSLDIIAGFATKYEGAKVFNLKTNFRSTPEVIDLATHVIGKNERLYPKEIKVHRNSKHMEQPKPRYCQFPNSQMQVDSIMRNILRNSIDSEPHVQNHVPIQENAIIYRSNTSGNIFELACKEYNIPYTRKGGISFFDRYEIVEALNILEILHNPKDALAWSKMLDHVSGLGTVTVKKIIKAMQLASNGGSLMKPFLQHGYVQGTDFLGIALPTRAIGHLQSAHQCLARLQQCKKPAEFFEALLKESFFTDTVLFEYLKATFKKGRGQEAIEELEKRKDKIEILRRQSEKYDTVAEFMSSVALQTSKDFDTKEQCITLMTIHSAKGLEWKKVFLVDVYDGSFPNTRLMGESKDETAMKKAVEEERRLFYVAITRAKDYLLINYPKKQLYANNKEQLNSPSRFMDEVMEEGSEKVVVLELR